MLVTSLFVIIVMGFLGLTLTQMLSVSSDSVSYEVLGLRAMNAARSGLDDNLSNVFPIDGGTSSCAGLYLDYSGVTGMSQCSSTSSCSVSTVDGSNYYRFASTGTCTSGSLVVSRTVEIDAREVE